MSIHHLKWSASEKKTARHAFDRALDTVLAKTMAEFKAKAAAAAVPDDMWDIEDYLKQQRRRIDDLFDYRYSELVWVFSRLVAEGHLEEAQLNGLSQEKRDYIREFVARLRTNRASTA